MTIVMSQITSLTGQAAIENALGVLDSDPSSLASWGKFQAAEWAELASLTSGLALEASIMESYGVHVNNEPLENIEYDGDDTGCYFQLEPDTDEQTFIQIPDTWNIDFEMRMSIASTILHHKAKVADGWINSIKPDRKRTHARLNRKFIYRRSLRNVRTLEMVA
jgi:hypothetical protein